MNILCGYYLLHTSSYVKSVTHQTPFIIWQVVNATACILMHLSGLSKG